MSWVWRESGVGRAGRVLSLVAVVSGFILSSLDPHAAERTPWHDHIVVGAHGLEEWAHALVSHHHGHEQWEDTTAMTGPLLPARSGATCRTQPSVLSVRGLDGAGASIFDINGPALAGLNELAALPAPSGTEPLPQNAVNLVSPIAVPVPEPPPRVSS